jgi:hypothetical protein
VQRFAGTFTVWIMAILVLLSNENLEAVKQFRQSDVEANGEDFRHGDGTRSFAPLHVGDEATIYSEEQSHFGLAHLGFGAQLCDAATETGGKVF